MPVSDDPLDVFLCHASNDYDQASRLCANLSGDGFNVWLAKENLLPGQNRELEIHNALRSAKTIIVCLSKEFDQAGNHQKEVRIALDESALQPEGTILIVPARLEECEIPENLKRWEHVDLFEAEGYKNLIDTLKLPVSKTSPQSNNDQKLASPYIARKKKAVRRRRKKPSSVSRLKKKMSFKPEVIAAIITAISAIIVGILNSPAVGKIINFPQSYIITPTLMPSESFYREDVIYPNEYSDTDLAGNQIYMKLVPSGKFLLGSKFGIHDGNLVQEVNLSAFYIDVYEVTNTLYQACVSAGACLPPTGVESYSRNSYYQSIDFVDYPVVNVNWYMAQSYCEWRGMQLPTEPQWEKAARGGLQGKSYPWGESMPVCEKGVENGAKFDDNVRCNGTDTEIVGNYFSNGFGLYDMAGNVWEWTRSLYKPYPYVAKDGRENMELIDPRVLRGGSWRNAQYLQRVSFRNKAHPDLASNMVGFRCVRLLP